MKKKEKNMQDLELCYLQKKIQLLDTVQIKIVNYMFNCNKKDVIVVQKYV